MADPLIDRLDRTIDALLARGDATAALADPALAPLARIAADLRYGPDEGFRARLRARLERTEQMFTTMIAPVREGFTTVTPYIAVRDSGLVEFLRTVFSATETSSSEGGGGRHRELRIGDSMLMVGENPGATLMPTEFHVYVDDVDATFRRALAAGATSIGEPADRPYGERSGFVRDAYGNHWFIARASKGPAVPAGVRTVTPFLHVPDAANYIAFLERALGAAEENRHASSDGHVMYARVRVGNAAIELGAAGPAAAAMPGRLYVYVSDVDAVHARAVESGATSLWAPRVAPYGEYVGGLKDPAGNEWYVARPA